MDDTYFMAMALDLALHGQGFTSPNPMVGAVIVKDELVVGMGYHRNVGGAHAEVHAIDDAEGQARGATLYVSLEPCNHTGRTPPCTQKIIEAGISRVVMAMPDPNPDVAGGGAQTLRAHGIEVLTGVCEDKARRLNESFVKFVQAKRPFVTLKCAATLDGQIATRSGDARWVTGPQAREHVHRMRHANDAIMVGIGTVRADDPELTTRLEDIKGKDPVRVILDTQLTICEKARLVNQKSEAPTVIVAGETALTRDDIRTRQRRLEQRGAQILGLPEVDGRLDLDLLMERLADMQIQSVLVEGGSHVSASALAAGIVDKVFLFYAPKLLGGRGIPMCDGNGADLMARATPVKDIAVRHFGNDIAIEGYLYGN